MNLSSFFAASVCILMLVSCTAPTTKTASQQAASTPVTTENTIVQPKPTYRDRLDNYTDWAIYRGDKKANQYAQLAQIHAANVHMLEKAWEYHTGDFKGPSMYSNPIIVDGLLY